MDQSSGTTQDRLELLQEEIELLSIWMDMKDWQKIIHHSEKSPKTSFHILGGKLFFGAFGQLKEECAQLQSLIQTEKAVSEKDNKLACISDKHRSKLEKLNKQIVINQKQLRKSEKIVDAILDLEIKALDKNYIFIKSFLPKKKKELMQRGKVRNYCRRLINAQEYPNKKFLESVILKTSRIAELGKTQDGYIKYKNKKTKVTDLR